ncbi:MAG: ImmA/IrrE family metallo-endopeptidase [Gammaproteobacteria bacterium]|nr:ImmA/IrrE family metallo-endopeptidase [Gammaproteobacteria bacterium]
MAALEAEQLVREQGINKLPINPTEIAESLGILVEPKKTRDGVSGMLIRVGNEFGIAYATHIRSEGFRRFSIAHEIGHYRIPGHLEAVLAHGDIHESHAGFVKGLTYEREADHFAASLLMPNDLFTLEMRSHGDGLAAIEALAERCVTSLPAAANRYIQKARVPVAMIVSTRPRIDYCFMSGPMKDFKGLDWPRRGQLLPKDSMTERFNLEPRNIRAAKRAEAEVDLRLWFGTQRKIPGTEEIVGLGRYGKTLTILTSTIFADDEDEESELEEGWKPKFRR